MCDEANRASPHPRTDGVGLRSCLSPALFFIVHIHRCRHNKEAAVVWHVELTTTGWAAFVSCRPDHGKGGGIFFFHSQGEEEVVVAVID